MKFGDRLHGVIERLDDKGRGVFAIDLPQSPGERRQVVVPFTTIGDEVDAIFVRRDSGQWLAKLDRIERPSADRVAAVCPHAGSCGGCLWQQMGYDAQRQAKRDAINRAFKQAGYGEPVLEVEAAEEKFYYRNRMDYVIGWRGELGLKEYGAWNRYLDLSTCLLLDTDTPTILTIVRQLLLDLRLEPWDARQHTGQCRYCVIRIGKQTKQRMITLVVKDAAAIDATSRATIVDRLKPWCTTLYLGENPDITDLSYAKTLFLLAGQPYLIEQVNGCSYQIHPNAFFQTNSGMAAHLQNTVLDFVNRRQPRQLLDLYCGLGFFSIALARTGMTVHGHELDAAAVALARDNARLNGVVDSAGFSAGPAEDLSWTRLAADAIIVDPPRAGLHPNALQAVIDHPAKTLIYVSCNYHSFIKELAALEKKFQLTSVKALDLFPQTPHVEIVSLLTAKA